MNDQFNDLPVAYWFKSLFVLMATGLYTQMLQHIHPASYPRSAWLLGILVVALIGNTGLIFLGAERVLSPQQTYYSMMTLSDLAVMLNMVLLFLPVNFIMYHQERLEPMRMKHIATLIFCTFYTIAAAMTQVLGPYTVITGRVSPLHNLIPLGMIVFFCFMIQLLPHKAIHKLLYIERILMYFKLRKLEKRVMALSGHQSQLPTYLNLLSEKQVQEATYLALINILDYSRDAATGSVKGNLLYCKIMNAAAQNANFDVLVRAVARVA
jgi:hypothetical protein